ncbi:MAG: hypothetical protein Q9177_001621, partial [Variospora cf. flavescens]
VAVHVEDEAVLVGLVGAGAGAKSVFFREGFAGGFFALGSSAGEGDVEEVAEAGEACAEALPGCAGEGTPKERNIQMSRVEEVDEAFAMHEAVVVVVGLAVAAGGAADPVEPVELRGPRGIELRVVVDVRENRVFAAGEPEGHEIVANSHIFCLSLLRNSYGGYAISDRLQLTVWSNPPLSGHDRSDDSRVPCGTMTLGSSKVLKTTSMLGKNSAKGFIHSMISGSSFFRTAWPSDSVSMAWEDAKPWIDMAVIAREFPCRLYMASQSCGVPTLLWSRTNAITEIHHVALNTPKSVICTQENEGSDVSSINMLKTTTTRQDSASTESKTSQLIDFVISGLSQSFSTTKLAPGFRPEEDQAPTDPFRVQRRNGLRSQWRTVYAVSRNDTQYD